MDKPSRRARVSTNHANGTYVPFSSNTVMAVVPDSNRIPFYLLSEQLFKPYLLISKYEIVTIV